MEAMYPLARTGTTAGATDGLWEWAPRRLGEVWRTEPMELRAPSWLTRRVTAHPVVPTSIPGALRVPAHTPPGGRGGWRDQLCAGTPARG